MIRVAIVWIATSSIVYGDSRVEPLPEFSSTANWRVESNAFLSGIVQWPGRISVEFTGSENQSARLLLAQKKEIPEWADGFTFLMGNSGDKGRVAVKAIIEDETGGEFLYRLLESAKEFETGYPVFKRGFRGMIERLQATGLKRPKFGTGAWDTITSLDRKGLPKGKLKLKGLYLEGGATPTRAVLSFGDFAWTHLVANESRLYYAFKNREHFGELEPEPFITLTEFGKDKGGIYDVSWEARSSFDGPVVMSDHRRLALNPGDPANPLPAQLGERITFPISQPGTYWITVKLRWSRDEARFPESVEEKSYRLDVIHARPAESAKSQPQPAPQWKPQIKIGAGRASLAYGAAEKAVVPIAFHPESPIGPDFSYRVFARRFGDGQIVKTATNALTAPGTLSFDLSDQPPGAWNVSAELWAGERLLDRSERLIGKQPEKSQPEKTKKTSRKKPAPTAPASLAGTDPTKGQSQIILAAQIPDPMRDDPEQRWQGIQPLLDQAASVSQTIELHLYWKYLEPMPGLFDWSWVDKVMDYAASKGLKVIIDPGFVGSEPIWIPPYFTQNKEGAVFGHQRYLFCGMRANHWHAKPLHDAVVTLFSTIAKRYANHPAFKGCLILTEHPGEFPYAGWYDGYDPETLANYKAEMQRRWKDLAVLNERWGTRYQTWDELGIPDSEAGTRHRLDWLAFRHSVIPALLIDAANAVRSGAPNALIEVYTGGMEGSYFKELRRLGAILANGGAHQPELTGLDKAKLSVYGVQERAEEWSVGRWSALGATQLDATLYNMMMAGGPSAHCKMFIRSNAPLDELRKAPFSLDRFEKFIPIWEELRPTQAPKREAFVLNDLDARLMEADSTTFLSFGNSNIARTLQESRVIAPMVDAEMAVSGKLLFCFSSIGTSYETALDDKLENYVKAGGTLVMTADAGRKSPDRPGEDWILLRRFGLEPPSEPGRKNVKAKAVTMASTAFPEAGKAFFLADPIPTGQGAGEVLASYDDGRPAITWRAVGKGRVIVLWASNLVPPSLNGDAVSYLTDIARWASVESSSTSTHPAIYTNLLRHRTQPLYYGLAYHSGEAAPWGVDGPALDAATKWQLPPGNYEVTELISGQSLGIHPAEELRETGIPTKIRRHAVAIFRLKPISQ